MSKRRVVCFAAYRLETATGQLWRGDEQVPLRPKVRTLLQYLVAQAGREVSRDELLDVLWPDTYGRKRLLSGRIHELRWLLGDDAQAPQFIETVGRRGYRFIAPVTTTQPVQSLQSAIRNPQSAIVGREAELEQLHGWLEKALAGERQVVFVMGEAGIGKTTIVDAFLHGLAAEEDVWIGRGQCIAHYGAGEAYLPVLDCLGQLGQGPRRERLLAALRQYAPTWLLQLPALLSATERETLQQHVTGATQERMLRELVEAFDALTAEQPVVLAFDDLHWSDASTIDWLAAVARRRRPARLLVLGMYRPADVSLSNHPLKALKQELLAHGECAEQWPRPLTTEEVERYLSLRYPQQQFPSALGRRIHQRTEGNPLFMVNAVEYLVAQGLIGEAEGQWQVQGPLDALVQKVPASSRQLIEKYIERLPREHQRVLEVASVVGNECTVAAVAAGSGAAVEEVEEQCEELARHGHLLRPAGSSEWPDGTVVARYEFTHALYQQVLYERMGTARRSRLHQRVGEYEEAAYGERAGEIAAELAMHFEQGRDYQRAVRYHQRAAETALQRLAYVEARNHLGKGLELVATLPDTPERTRQELTLQAALAPVLMATSGLAVPEVEAVYARARALCRQVGESPQLFSVLFGLRLFSFARAEHETARELGEQLLRLAQSAQEPAFLPDAHLTLGESFYFLGEFAQARAYLEQGLTAYDFQERHVYGFRHVADFGRICLFYRAFILWYLGYPDQALQSAHQAFSAAQESSHPLTLSVVLNFAGLLPQLRRDASATQERAEAAIRLATEHEVVMAVAWGTILRGWALAVQGQGEEGIAQLQQGLAGWRATGAEMHRPYYLAMLADAYGTVGQTEKGLAVLAEALTTVNKTGERFYEAELYRLKGQLTLQSQASLRQVKTSQNKSRQVSESKVHSRQSAIRSRRRKSVSGTSPLSKAPASPIGTMAG